MRIAIYTLGCKVNQYETQAMEQELAAQGHELVDFEQAADAYIINTCSVTAVSDKKSRQMIRRAKNRNPAAIIAACGCYVQTHTDEAAALGIDLIGGTGQRMEFLHQLLAAAEEKQTRILVDDALRRHEFEILPAGGQHSRTRAMLKVEDGCRNFCTYCIIPFARGPVRSLPLAAAARQTEQLARQGYREVVLTGIEISSWGQDLPGQEGLIDLLEAVSAAAGTMRVRLGSLEPRTVTEEFCRRASALKNLCPHFHLSLQSGCDATLRRMNRRYDTTRFIESALLLHRFFPDCALTTDLIVGFPGKRRRSFHDPGLYPPLWLRPDPCFSLLRPPRNQGGGYGAGPQKYKGGAGRPGRGRLLPLSTRNTCKAVWERRFPCCLSSPGRRAFTPVMPLTTWRYPPREKICTTVCVPCASPLWRGAS